jgi:hypothetical protein
MKPSKPNKTEPSAAVSTKQTNHPFEVLKDDAFWHFVFGQHPTDIKRKVYYYGHRTMVC